MSKSILGKVKKAKKFTITHAEFTVHAVYFSLMRKYMRMCITVCVVTCRCDYVYMCMFGGIIHFWIKVYQNFVKFYYTFITKVHYLHAY